MKYMWDERYAVEEYVYGTEPNAFFKQEIDKLTPGKLLLPAEGEGRNAVYAASLGWEVHAFDLSVEGYKKAMRLAKTKHVNIKYEVAGFDDVELKDNYFDLVFLCYVHLPSMLRQKYHRIVLQALKPKGTMLLEGFSKTQIDKNTGGPKNVDMLFSKEELTEDFKDMESLSVNSLSEILSEGDFHAGEADIIRLKGIK